MTGFFESYGRNHILEIDSQLDGVLADVEVAGGPYTMAIRPDGKSLYVVTSDGVTVIDTESSSVVAAIPLPLVAELAVDGEGSSVYAVRSSLQSIARIDTATNEVAETIRLSEAPDSIAVVDVPPPIVTATPTPIPIQSHDATQTRVVTSTSHAIVVVQSDPAREAGRRHGF